MNGHGPGAGAPRLGKKGRRRQDLAEACEASTPPCDSAALTAAAESQGDALRCRRARDSGGVIVGQGLGLQIFFQAMIAPVHNVSVESSPRGASCAAPPLDLSELGRFVNSIKPFIISVASVVIC